MRRDLGDAAPHFDRGAEWGHFEFGSTLIMLLPPDGFELDVRPVGTLLRLGEAIGRRAADSRRGGHEGSSCAVEI
jgi:hypothetical protein